MNQDSRCGVCGGIGLQTRPGVEHAEALLCERCLDPCPDCAGEGEVLATDDKGYRVVRRCARCGSARALAAVFGRARIPPRYHDATLRSYRDLGGSQGSVRDFLLDYLRRRRPAERGVLLIGDPGVGKTHLLAALVRGLSLHHGLPCAFLEFGQLLGEIKLGYERGRTEEQIIGPLVRVPVLAIDDLGKGKGSDWEMNILDALVSRRYNAGRCLLVTTNYQLRSPLDAGQPAGSQMGDAAPAQKGYTAGRSRAQRMLANRSRLAECLEDRVGARVASRLGEMCHVRILKGPDYRKMGFR